MRNTTGNEMNLNVIKQISYKLYVFKRNFDKLNENPEMKNMIYDALPNANEILKGVPLNSWKLRIYSCDNDK